MPIETAKTKSMIVEGFTDSVIPESAAWMGFETTEYLSLSARMKLEMDIRLSEMIPAVCYDHLYRAITTFESQTRLSHGVPYGVKLATVGFQGFLKPGSRLYRHSPRRT